MRASFFLILSNPPWGAAYTAAETRALQQLYPGIRSGESFAFFLRRGLDLLAPGGVLSYILPEAILNVRVHQDIRAHLAAHTTILRISRLGRAFHGVFTPVIRLDLAKCPAVPDHQVQIEYPFRAIRTPDGYDVTLFFTCESVCRNQGELLRNQPTGLRQRLWVKQFRGPEVAEHVPLSLGSGATVPWAVYRDWEGILLDRLMEMPDSGDAPLKAGSLQLKEWLGESLAGPAWQAQEILHQVCTIERDSDPGMARSPRLHAWQSRDSLPVTFAGDWDMLSRYFRNILFRKNGLSGIHRSTVLPWAATLLVN